MKRDWPASKIHKRRVDALIPNARNARTHSDEQVAQIAASITEWGWTTPILLDEADNIIAGHGRVLAAQQLGIVEAPCIIASGWTDEQKRAYTIADNKLALNAGWDIELLSAELGGLINDEFDISLIGFSEDDMARLADDLAEIRLGDDDDENERDVREQHDKGDFVNLTLLMLPDHRERVFEVIRHAMSERDISLTGEALYVITQEWMQSQEET